MIWKFLINVRQRSLGKTVYCGNIRLLTTRRTKAGKVVPAICCFCTSKDTGTYWFIFQASINKTSAPRIFVNPQTKFVVLKQT
ncbi:hypothetical protein T4D_11935 [Trichinella pseudospiralis]|uniref:Uncharacterized protein n=1 Tax=Trichinella pseudospiralis TaxID=6337 RepID=A0A0V1FLJ6_TRIPS|nr:hypothetical protein T4D_11935 [Trichinella pseudospiralis]